MPEQHAPFLTLSRRNVRELERLLADLKAQGLEWLTIDDVLRNLDPVFTWRQGLLDDGASPAVTEPEPRLRLSGLCSRTGWPLPAKDGRDHTTPAALAVFRAKERLAEAMLADHKDGAGANQIAARAVNAQSRPATLKILASMRLMDDAVTALTPVFEADGPVILWHGKRPHRADHGMLGGRGRSHPATPTGPGPAAARCRRPHPAPPDRTHPRLGTGPGRRQHRAGTPPGRLTTQTP